MKLPTDERIREHFMNYLDANLGDFVEHFIGCEYDDDDDSDDPCAVEAAEIAYIRVARGIIAELHANTR